MECQDPPGLAGNENLVLTFFLLLLLLLMGLRGKEGGGGGMSGK